MTIRILAIDTSTGPCSVAIWQKERISAYIENTKPVMQSASLMPMVEEALQKSNLTYKELDLVASTIGPGSFTGIRVGLASARAIALATGIATAGYTTLDVLGYAVGKTAPVLSILNAGKGEVYYQLPNGTAQLGTLDAVLAVAPKTAIIAGNITIDPPDFTHSGITFPRADALAALAASGNIQPQPLHPFYIRPPDAKLPNSI